MEIREKDVERKVCDYAKKQGLLPYKFSSPATSFVCDRIFITEWGSVFFIEFKRPGGKPTPGQSRHHQELAKRNVTVYVVDNVEMGKEVIDHEQLFKKTNRHHWSAIRYVSSDQSVTREEQI